MSPRLGGDASAVLSGLLADGNVLLARPWNWLLQVPQHLGSYSTAVLPALPADTCLPSVVVTSAGAASSWQRRHRRVQPYCQAS